MRNNEGPPLGQEQYTPENIDSAMKSISKQLASTREQDIVPIAYHALEVFAWKEHFSRGGSLTKKNTVLDSLNRVLQSSAANQIRENFLSIRDYESKQPTFSNRVNKIRDIMKPYIPAKFLYRPLLLHIEPPRIFPPQAAEMAAFFLDTRRGNFSALFESIENSADILSDASKKRQAFLLLAGMAQIAQWRIRIITQQVVGPKYNTRISPGMEKEFWEQKLIGEPGKEGIIFCGQYAKEALETIHAMLPSVWGALGNDSAFMYKVWEQVSAISGVSESDEKRIAPYRASIVSALVLGNENQAGQALLNAAIHEPGFIGHAVKEIFEKQDATKIGRHYRERQQEIGKQTAAKSRERVLKKKKTKESIEQEQDEILSSLLEHLLELATPDAHGVLVPSGRFFMLEQRSYLQKQNHNIKTEEVECSRIHVVEYTLERGKLHYKGEKLFHSLKMFVAFYKSGLIIDHGENTEPFATFGDTIGEYDASKSETKPASIQDKARGRAESEIIDSETALLNNHVFLRIRDVKNIGKQIFEVTIIQTKAPGGRGAYLHRYMYDAVSDSFQASGNISAPHQMLLTIRDSENYVDIGEVDLSEKKTYLLKYRIKNLIKEYLGKTK